MYNSYYFKDNTLYHKFDDENKQKNINIIKKIKNYFKKNLFKK